MIARAQPKLAMRPLLPVDVPLLAEIFRAGIEELTADDYSEAQRAAWASTADDEEAFGARLCDALEKLAAARGSKEREVEASDSAGGFFEKRGFVTKTRNTISLAGE